jgi:hypothetical protein
MPASRSVQQGNRRVGEKFLYDFKAGPAGGRRRRPPSAGKAAAVGRLTVRLVGGPSPTTQTPRERDQASTLDFASAPPGPHARIELPAIRTLMQTGESQMR